MKRTLLSVIALLMLFAHAGVQTQGAETGERFITVNNGQLMRDGKPYYYVGANFWYGAILGSEGSGGNRLRLSRELDSLKALGVDNLRILVGSDGLRGVQAKVEPTLQTAPKEYNDTILAGLDYLLAEMKRRDMVAVLYLNNSWEWSGGYGQYLEWAGYGKAPAPTEDGYQAYMDFAGQFTRSDKAQALFADYVRDIISRTNRYTGLRYADDPTIMSWQIGNEPRAFSSANKEAFAEWIEAAAALIDSLAPRQLVSTGSEGLHGCEEDMALFERIHACRHIDYMTVHIWPYNWGWAPEDKITENVGKAKTETKKYIDAHLDVARRLMKPLVIEEFGYPRDGFSHGKDAPTTARDEYYAFVFGLVGESARGGGLLAGCNFWGWGGLAGLSSGRTSWQPGDDYTGDPAQEAQGLNSVFCSDTTTTQIIKKANDAIKD